MTTDTVGKDTVGKAAILRLQTAYRKRIAKKRVAGFKLLRDQQVRFPAFVCLFVCLLPPNDPQRHTYGLLVQVVAPGWERRLAYPSGEIFYYNPTTGACMRV